MRIIINNSSMIPIYEQLVEQIKSMIMSGELAANEGLPSVRAMAKELKISALTVKKVYDILEEEGGYRYCSWERYLCSGGKYRTHDGGVPKGN